MRCPQCDSEVIMEGKIYNQVDYINPPAYFRPSNLKFYEMFKSNFRIHNIFFVCSLCGFLWSRIDKRELERSL